MVQQAIARIETARKEGCFCAHQGCLNGGANRQQQQQRQQHEAATSNQHQEDQLPENVGG
eukprot:scaffold145549_cov18-Tisochrysis_lutea.AAC.2